MLHNIVSVCTVCLFLAIVGWREPVTDESDDASPISSSVYGSELWSWPRDGELMNCEYGRCNSTSSVFPQAVSLLHIGVIRELLVSVVYMFQMTQEAVDSLHLSNSAMMLVSLIVQILWLLLLRAHRSNRNCTQSLIRRRRSFEWLTDEIKQTKERNWRRHLHEEEMELMAQTIEYLQRGNGQVTHLHPVKVLKVTYPPMITCECPDIQSQLPVQSDVSVTEQASASPSSSEEDFDLFVNSSDPEFIQPDYEWDSEYDFG